VLIVGALGVGIGFKWRGSPVVATAAHAAPDARQPVKPNAPQADKPIQGIVKDMNDSTIMRAPAALPGVGAGLHSYGVRCVGRPQ